MSCIHCFQYFVYSFCINFFIVLLYVIYYSDFLAPGYYTEIKGEYDYIIVGAGTAGSVIGHRINKETNYTFIILEAGGHGHPVLDIPVAGPLLHGSVFDWQYETVPQKHGCFAMDHKVKKCKLPQGKIIGGSSKLNNMVHVRGNLTHYVDWFHQKYSKEYIQSQFEYIEKEIIQLDDIRYESALTDAILEAAQELGYEHIDVNSKYSKGFMKSKVSQRNGKRWSTSENIDFELVVSKAFVEKVDIDKHRTATGVTFIRHGKKYTVKAKKGVILSAGTFNSPKILQLSGIGPTKILKHVNIPVVKELPVGMNLQDHVTTGLDLILFNTTLNIAATDMLNPLYMYQYFLHGKGPLTTPGCEVVGFLSTKNNSTPDLQFMVLPVGISSDRGSHLRKSLGINDEVWLYFAQTFNKHTATILPILLHPKSKGEVYIQSINPFESPRIDPQYLSDKDDVETLVKGLHLVKDFVETKAMRDIGAHLNSNKFPGCEAYEIFSDIYWECYLKQLTLSSYHPVGTCSMGLPGDKTAVVDTNFQVIGIDRLYVADGSVLPTLPSGNINAAIAMMANMFFEQSIKHTSIETNRSCRREAYIWNIFLRPNVCEKFEVI